MAEKTVATVAALRELKRHETGDRATVLDSEDQYRYNASAAGADDSDLIVKPANVGPEVHPGRWVKIQQAAGDLADESVSTEKLDSDLADQLAGMASGSVGRRAVNILRVASDVVSGTKVTIGDDVYEIEIVNTDSTDDTDNDDFNNTDPETTIDEGDYSHITFLEGMLLRVANEIMRVVSNDEGTVTIKRGASGTTIAAHADGVDIYVGDGIAGGSTIAVGLVTTLTPAAFSPALVADINEEGTMPVTATKISNNEILLVADDVGTGIVDGEIITPIACTETLAGANNAWAAATMFGGAAAGPRHLEILQRVPTAVEVALGHMYFQLGFEPASVIPLVSVTLTPGVAKAWDGGVTIAGTRITLDNGGNTDWAATDTVTLIAID